MAYPNNFYNPNYYQPQPQQMIPQQQRSNDFILVPNEQVARNYPVAPGNSVNFKDENAAYIYTKTMGFSQFDQPTFKKYKLIEEQSSQTPSETLETDESIKILYEQLKLKVDGLESALEAIKADLKEGV